MTNTDRIARLDRIIDRPLLATAPLTALDAELDALTPPTRPTPIDALLAAICTPDPASRSTLSEMIAP